MFAWHARSHATLMGEAEAERPLSQAPPAPQRVLVVDGSVNVTESNDSANTVVQVSEDTLLRLVRSEENTMTALLSGRLEVQGNLADGEKLLRALCGT
jgi:putative sterol carrier protein